MCFTEAEIADDFKEKFMVRGAYHPKCQNETNLFDWALVDWSAADKYG